MSNRYMYYLTKTKMTTHSCKRFWEYVEDTTIGKQNWTITMIRKVIAKSLVSDIRKGLLIDKTGAFHIPLNLGLGLYAAVVVVDEGFLAVTIHKNEKNIDIDKLREEKLAK